jgi:parallel beta-helix repeat protein
VAVRTAQDATVLLENAWNCAVEDCKFIGVGGYAVRLHLDTCENRIAGNTVTEAGAGGVLLTSAKVGYGEAMTRGEEAARYAPIRNVITRNHIHHCGMIHKYVSGVHLDSRPASLARAQGNEVSHNLIHDMPRLGIFAFQHQGGNTFEGNHIHHVMLESDDGGGIHIAAGDMNTSQGLLRSNVIHDVYGPRCDANGAFTRKYGFGIYLDNATSNCLVTNNVVYRTSWGAVFLHGGQNNLVENNILADDAVQQILVSNYTGKMSGNRLRRNILCCTTPEAKMITLKKFTDETLAESDYNLFWAAGRPVEIDPIGSLAEWQKKGFDAHSLVADPLFVDPARDNYTLRPGSPAPTLGFAPFVKGNTVGDAP